MITQKELKRILQYNPDTGEWIWLVHRGRVTLGSEAGTLVGNGYRDITINGKHYYTSKLAWLYMTGEWPISVDHWDRNPSNEKWNNLREATYSQQCINRGLQSNNTSGVKGVFWDKRYSYWVANIQVKRKNLWLGAYDNFEDAVAVRKQAEETYHGEFRPSQSDRDIKSPVVPGHTEGTE